MRSGRPVLQRRVLQCRPKTVAILILNFVKPSRPGHPKIESKKIESKKIESKILSVSSTRALARPPPAVSVSSKLCRSEVYFSLSDTREKNKDLSRQTLINSISLTEEYTRSSFAYKSWGSSSLLKMISQG